VFKLPMLPRSLEATCRDLADPNRKVRLSAVRDAPRHSDSEGRERILPLLIRILDESTDSGLRVAVLVALADGGMHEAIGNILPLLTDGDLDVRRYALLALGELAEEGDSLVLSKIAPFLGATDPRVRYQALSATFALAGTGASAALCSAKDDADARIRELLARLLGELLDLGNDEAARAALHSLTGDEHPLVRAVAQLMCLERGIDAPTDGVVALVARALRPGEPRDEQLAIELSGRLRIRPAEPALTRRAFGILGLSADPFRFHARVALAALGHAAAVRSVERGLRRGNRLERFALLSAMAEVRARAFAPLIEAAQLDPELRESAEEALLALERENS
jgi:HEAT repeat protein